MSTHDLFQSPNYSYSTIRILKMISIFLVPLLDRTWFVCQRCHLKSFQQVDWWDQGQVTSFHWLKFLYIENWSKKPPIFSSLGFNTPWCEIYQVLSFCSSLSCFLVCFLSISSSTTLYYLKNQSFFSKFLLKDLNCFIAAAQFFGIWIFSSFSGRDSS